MRRSERDVIAYYRAALRGLRHLEHLTPTGRRFGADADARWGALGGELTIADRIDLLIRDADAQWPGALGARTAFALHTVAEDDAFGAGWTPLDPVDAETLWREVLAEAPPPTMAAAFVACADAWGLRLTAEPPPRVAAADRLVVVGPSALAAAAAAFAGDSGLDFAEQVIVCASPPAHRQLAGIAAAFLKATRPLVVLDAEASAGAVSGRRLLRSSDADGRDVARAEG